ncbi:MAG: hypothetical protein KJ667_08845, partial [Alphaproteobacteria bacterium]|nr:hypothetical protein [Alphaproteobacteria bacterium]
SLVIMSDPPFGRPVCRVEYYRDQHLMMLVYDDPDHEGDLMHYELSERAITQVETSPSVMIVGQTPDHRLHGYDVPLIHVGL